MHSLSVAAYVKAATLIEIACATQSLRTSN